MTTTNIIEGLQESFTQHLWNEEEIGRQAVVNRIVADVEAALTHVRKETINDLARGIEKALAYEWGFSRKYGFEQGHYWLQRKITQLVEEMGEYADGEWTPHFSGICQCVDVKFGSYKNTVGMLPPEEIASVIRDQRLGGLPVTIDTCIASEIGYLWHQGVVTLNSCCGHNQSPGNRYRCQRVGATDA
jgi:hypothetical protein